MSIKALIVLLSVVLVSATCGFSQSPESFTQFMAMVGRGDVTNVLDALKKNPQFSHQKNEKGTTALHWARKIEIVKALLLAGADVHAEDNNGNTPLHPLCLLPENITLPLIEILVSKGAKINHQAKDGNTPLLRAIGFCNCKMATFLIENGADVNLKASEGPSPLSLAETQHYLQKIDAEFLKYLVQKGAKK